MLRAQVPEDQDPAEQKPVEAVPAQPVEPATPTPPPQRFLPASQKQRILPGLPPSRFPMRENPGQPGMPPQPGQPLQANRFNQPGFQPAQPNQPGFQPAQPAQPGAPTAAAASGAPAAGALPPPAPGTPAKPAQWRPSQPQSVAQPPAQPAGQPAAQSAENGEALQDIDYPNADIRQVLEVWEKLTGKKALYDNTVQGPCGVSARGVTKTEAIRIIETVLLLNNFSLVPGPGENIVRVMGAQRNPRQFGPPLYFNAADLPTNDMIVSFFFKLEFADPTEVHGIISQYVAPSSYTAMVALPKSQGILITENTSVIRSLVEIVKQLDRKPAEVVSEFIPLERADAKELIEKLNTIFEKQPTTPGAPGTPGAPAPAAAAPPAGEAQPAETAAPSATLSEDSLIVGKIKLTADVRTNRIHVVTRPVNLPFIRTLIKEYDSDVPFGVPATRPLRFVSAGDVLDVVVKAITEPGAKEEVGGGGTTAKPAAPVSNPSSYGGSGYGSSSSSGYGGGGRGSSMGGEELSTAAVDTVPEARTVGATKIIADKRSNSIIVLGNAEVKNKIFKILDEIDVRAPQVLLTAVIGELSLNDSKAFGVDYLLKKLGMSGTTTTTTGTSTTTSVLGSNGGVAGIAQTYAGNVVDLNSLTSASALSSTLGGGLGVSGFIAAGRSLEIIVHALESTGRFRVTSRPMIFTSNNKKALIASGQEVAVPATTQSGYGYGSSSLNSGLVSTANIEYKDVFLKLEVQPLINSENEVTLDIVQEVNSLDTTSAGAANSTGINAPTINSRRIKTTVSIANNATVVLGGLVQETRDDQRSGIPILSKIPMLGSLFTSKSKSINRSELIVLIRPTVSQSPTEDVRTGERAQEKYNFPPDIDATLDPKGTWENVKKDRNHQLLREPKAVLRTEE